MVIMTANTASENAARRSGVVFLMGMAPPHSACDRLLFYESVALAASRMMSTTLSGAVSNGV